MSGGLFVSRPIGVPVQFDRATLEVPSVIEWASLYQYDPLAKNPLRKGRSIFRLMVQALPFPEFESSMTSFSAVSNFL